MIAEILNLFSFLFFVKILSPIVFVIIVEIEVFCLMDSLNKIKELRLYQNGFLLELEKINLTKNEPIIKLTYTDVLNQLNQLADNDTNLNIKISDNYFGVKFNLGYQQNDVRVYEQSFGNQLLLNQILIFDSINSFSEQKTILKLTRRFQFIYDSLDDSLAKKLMNDIANFNTELTYFLNKPNLILRKNNSDTLYHQYEILKHINKKLQIIDDVVTKITTGYFDFRYRDKYYELGVPELNTIDTIIYTHKNKIFRTPFEINPLINKPDSLVFNLIEYLISLKNKTDNTILTIKKSLSVYENQDKIDSLDVIITKNQELLQNSYADANRYSNEESSKTPFSYRLLNSLNERSINQLKDKYLNNSLPLEEMIGIGNNLVCYYDFLLNNKNYLDAIGEMKKYWNDSLFTVYRDNPFDTRKLESKILEGIQNAANILLTHYANQLLNVKSCEQLNSEIDKITKLNSRLNYLIKNQQSINIQQLNKAIRRERVPSRIERILEL